jgi:hypothetical protein
VPGGGGVGRLIWHHGGARLAVAAGAYVYLADARTARPWACFGNTLAAAWKPPDRLEHCVMLLNLRTGERCLKHVQRLTAVEVQPYSPALP